MRKVQPTILIVDDHPEFRRVARAVLQADGFRRGRRSLGWGIGGPRIVAVGAIDRPARHPAPGHRRLRGRGAPRNPGSATGRDLDLEPRCPRVRTEGRDRVSDRLHPQEPSLRRDDQGHARLTRLLRRPKEARLILIGAIGTGVALEGLVSVRIGFAPYEARQATLTLVTGCLVGAAGIIAWLRAPGSQTGPLIVAGAAAWFIGGFRWAPSPVIAGLATQLPPGATPELRPDELVSTFGCMGGRGYDALARSWHRRPTTTTPGS